MRESSRPYLWSYRTGLVVGIASGILLGVAFAVVAVAIAVARVLSVGVLPQPGFVAAILMYLAAFPLVGLVAGVLNPLARTAVGACLLGALSFVPAVFGALYLMRGSLIPHTFSDVFALAMTAILSGGGSGFMFWKHVVRNVRESE